MTRRILPLCVSVALAGLAACGGRASSADTDSALPVDAPTTDTPSTDMPAALHTLELRRFEEDNEPGMALVGCEYAERLKVYFRSRELITRFCVGIDGSYSGGRESVALLDTDLERIQQAYAELRVASGTQCEGSAGWLRLAVESEDDSDQVQVLDAEHSGCPLTGLEGEAFVEGLEQLYHLLAELRAR